jgi:hypothetical protein
MGKMAMSMKNKDFVVFIISHGRPDNVFTHATLKRRGYTGEVRIVIDDTDKKAAEYEKNFPGQIIIFDKAAIAATTDQGDNFNNLRTTTHARNACFDIAEKLGIKYFLVLDDDYPSFQYRFDQNLNYVTTKCVNLDRVFDCVLEFFKATPAVQSIALAQGGDFIGGADCENAQKVRFKRKCMNSFFCSTDRRFRFLSRLNEDVNTYITLGSRGTLFFTTNQVSLVQIQTQQTAGGMTEAYLAHGTYVKSFYSVMYKPSSAKISRIQDRGSSRIHHSIKWRNTVPLILREALKKPAC